MKSKLTVLVALIFSLFMPAAAYADDANNISILKTNKSGGIDPQTSPSTVFSNLIAIIFIGGVLAVLFMLVTGAFNWITSGGEKEAVGKARGRILNAIIGLLILALAFLIVRVVGSVVRVDITKLQLPSLDQQ